LALPPSRLRFTLESGSTFKVQALNWFLAYFDFDLSARGFVWLG
jgi:hypothetical protein